jgi:hypothetical protein
MPELRRHLVRAFHFALTAGLLVVGSRPAVAADALAPLKARQIRMLAQEPMNERREMRERAERARELRRLARRMKQRGVSSIRVRGERARPEVVDEDVRVGRVPQATLASTPLAVTVTGPPRPNVRCNNPAADAAGTGQSETSIVRWRNYMLAAWNDGQGWNDGTNQTQGWATSVDGGVTWVDQGTFPGPTGFPAWVWTSDPVLAVNTATGAFYYSGLANADASTSAIGVIKGRFNTVTNVFTWGTPSVVRTVNASVDFLDKQWIAVDPTTPGTANGRVYISYTRFPSSVNGGISEINAQWADSALATWSAPLKLSQASEGGRVQGSRPAVGPTGTVYVMYYLIGTVDVDYYRICTSTNAGASYGLPVDAVSLFTNYGTGAPAFNRPQGIQFASFAVDRSGGAHNGRLYLTWAESLNWFDDANNLVSGSTGPKNEVRPDSLPVTATPASIGQTLRGTIASTTDFDYYGVALAAGQSVIVAADSLSSGQTITLRMFASDGTTRLAYTNASDTDLIPGFAPPEWMYTAPATGTYYIRVASFAGTGAYRLRTGFAAQTTERGRDQRDVFVAYSDDAVAWSTPVRVSDSAPGYDDWLPEVAVAGDGSVFCTWYDWRNALAATRGGESQVFIARSNDGGTTWAVLGPTSDAKTAWTNVVSNIAPNQGDYNSLFADGTGVIACWGDGRAGTPDVYMAYWTLGETPTQLALVSASATAGRVDLHWFAGTSPGFAATVYRREAAGAWNALASIYADAAGNATFTDTDVVPGATYEYRLGVVEAGAERYYGQTSVNVPSGLEFALEGARPNPASREAWVSFTLPVAAPATLSLLDISGREIAVRDVGALGAGRHVVALGEGRALAPGVYLARLTQQGRSATARISIVR